MTSPAFRSPRLPRFLRTLPSILDQPLVRLLIKILLDAALAMLAWGLVTRTLGADLRPHPGIAIATWTASIVFFSILFQLQRQHYRFTGRSDFIRIIISIVFSTIISIFATSLEIWQGRFIRYDIFIFSGCTTGLLWICLRSAVAEGHDIRNSVQVIQERDAPPPVNVLIHGAGHAGHLILQETLRHPELGYKVVGFVDDAREKQGGMINGTPVLGASPDLPRLIRRFGVTQVILAMPSASGQDIRHLTQQLSGLGVSVKTVPGLFNLLGDQSWIPEIKDVAIEDLLRRDPVSLDQTALREAIQDAVVLITGGGGSIGSELARQAAAFRPARIVLLGRGENSLWEAEQRLRTIFPNQAISLELCDVRDTTRLGQAFGMWRPDVVLHAAAHKHVPFLEKFPCEAVANNILGTRNVVRETRLLGAPTFVNISTDKAVNPTNVLGASKFIAECLVLAAAAEAEPEQRFISVRFGNVLGSRGSVIPVFRAQIQRGGPLTITHPDMTRYFMTIPEASQLVLQAGILGGNGRIYALDMGEPVKISDLAQDMARLSGLIPGQDIELRYTGLRPGEKLFEEIFHAEEDFQSPVHPKVFEGVRPPPPNGRLQRGVEALTEALTLPAPERQVEILKWLKMLVPTYRPSPAGLGRFEKAGADRSRGGSGHSVSAGR